MRKPIKKRKTLEPDHKYSSVLISRLINQVMRDGRKSIAYKITYGALEDAEKKTKNTVIEALDKAIENAGPQMELRSRRVGGANYQVPHEVRGDRKITLALRWIVSAARKGKGKSMKEKLAEEIINAINNTGDAVKRKENTHRMAEANRAFAHFAW